MKMLKRIIGCVALAALLGTVWVQAETVWIDNDFSSGDGANIASWKAIKSDQMSSAVWTIGSGKLNLNSVNVNWNGNARVYNLGDYSTIAGTSFTMSTAMVINTDSWTNANTNIGFSFLGSNNSNPWAAATGNTSYYAVLSGNGVLKIGQINNAAYTTLATGADTFGNLVKGASYTLTLDGIYNATGGLDMTFTVSDGSNSYGVDWSILASPYAGRYFGYYAIQGDPNSGGNTRLNLDFDYFKLSEYVALVPEPSALALLGLGAGLLIFLRKRGKK